MLVAGRFNSLQFELASPPPNTPDGFVGKPCLARGTHNRIVGCDVYKGLRKCNQSADTVQWSSLPHKIPPCVLCASVQHRRPKVKTSKGWVWENISQTSPNPTPTQIPGIRAFCFYNKRGSVSVVFSSFSSGWNFLDKRTEYVSATMCLPGWQIVTKSSHLFLHPAVSQIVFSGGSESLSASCNGRCVCNHRCLVSRGPRGNSVHPQGTGNGEVGGPPHWSQPLIPDLFKSCPLWAGKGHSIWGPLSKL